MAPSGTEAATAPAAAAATPHVLSGLPMDVVEDILWYASYKDSKTAYTLAFVSKAVSKLTAENRWRVIAITSQRQAFALQRTVFQARDPDDQGGGAACVLATKAYLDARGIDYNSVDNRSYISCDVVYLKIKCPGMTRSGEEKVESVVLRMPEYKKGERTSISLPSRQPEMHIEHLLIDTQGAQDDQGRSSLDHITKALQDDCVYLPWWPFWDGDGGEDNVYLEKLKCLSIGPGETEPMFDHWVDLPARHVSELTMVLDGSRGFVESWVPEILAYQSLDRLHVVTVGGGVGQPPWDDLERLRAGTTRPIEWEATTVEWLPSVGYLQRPHRGVTHLRYDAPRLAFEPATGTAQQLRRFLREVCFAIDDAEEWNLLLTRPFDVWQGCFKEAAVLQSWGFGQFRRLHLAWHTQDGEVDDAFSNELQGAVQDAFGWHGSKGPAQTVVAGQDDLRYDLLDPTRDKAHFKRGVLDGYTQDDENALQSLRVKLSSEVEDARWRPDGYVEPDYGDNHAAIVYGIRAPSTLLELGGSTGAFTKQQRLELFLDRAYGGQGAWATKEAERRRS